MKGGVSSGTTVGDPTLLRNVFGVLLYTLTGYGRPRSFRSETGSDDTFSDEVKGVSTARTETPVDVSGTRGTSRVYLTHEPHTIDPRGRFPLVGDGGGEGRCIRDSSVRRSR